MHLTRLDASGLIHSDDSQFARSSSSSRHEDGAIEDVESCEQRGGAVTFVVVRHRSGTAGFIGNPGARLTK
jgi:hypothetical protein